MTSFGSTNWAAVHSGHLTPKERAAYLFALVRAKFSLMLKRSGADPKKCARVDPDAIVVPDSTLARSAEEHCRDLSDDDLYGHCLRAYWWGALLAQYDGQSFDVEQLYVAAMLHDLGLTEAHCSDPQIHCFAVQGTYAADEFLKSQEAPQPLREQVAEAVCLHLNATVPLKVHGAVAHYLNAGTAFDVIGGPRFRELPKQARTYVLERHPRGGMKETMTGLLRTQMKARPCSRMGLLCKMGFAKMILAAPFAS